MKTIGYDEDNRFGNDRGGYRVSSAHSGVLGGQPPLPVGKRKAAPCPTCGARPYGPCQTRVGGKTRDNPEGVPYFKVMKRLHKERGRPNAGVPD